MRILLISWLLTMNFQASGMDLKTEVQQFHLQALPVLLCDSKGYFQNCFPDIRKTCAEKMRTIALICWDENKIWIGRQLEHAEAFVSRRHVDVRLGACVGRNFEKKFASHKIGDEKCQSDKGWP